MADINVITEDVRNFSRAGTGYNDSALRPLLVTRTCGGAELPGCLDFQRADAEATKAVMETVTRVEQLLNGVRQGAAKMAGIYDDADQNVEQVLRNLHLNSPQVEVREEGLPRVDQALETTLRLNSAR